MNCHSVLGGADIPLQVEKPTCEAVKGRIGPAFNTDPFTSAPTGEMPSFIIPGCTMCCAWAPIEIWEAEHLKAQSKLCGSCAPASIKCKLAWLTAGGHCTCYSKPIHIVVSVTFCQRTVLIFYLHREVEGTLCTEQHDTNKPAVYLKKCITLMTQQTHSLTLYLPLEESIGGSWYTTLHSPGNCPQSWMSLDLWCHC